MPHYQKFYVYLMTNRNRTVLYLGFTSDLKRRVKEHEKGLREGFSKFYHCHNLIYFERFKYVYNAIKREKEIKNWRREKKLALINTQNPQCCF
jgi:putative endonuclease